MMASRAGIRENLRGLRKRNPRPKTEAGVRGMAFIEAVIDSSKKNGRWTKLAV